MLGLIKLHLFEVHGGHVAARHHVIVCAINYYLIYVRFPTRGPGSPLSPRCPGNPIATSP